MEKQDCALEGSLQKGDREIIFPIKLFRKSFNSCELLNIFSTHSLMLQESHLQKWV